MTVLWETAKTYTFHLFNAAFLLVIKIVKMFSSNLVLAVELNLYLLLRVFHE